MHKQNSNDDVAVAQRSGPATAPKEHPHEEIADTKVPEIPKWQKWVLWLRYGWASTFVVSIPVANPVSIGCLAYANGLDNFTVSVYLNTAASSLNGAVQYTTLVVIQSMIMGVGKPPFAKLADVFGRAACLLVSVVFFTVGTITISASQSITDLAVGMIFFSIGNCGITLVEALIVSDLISARWRCTVSNVLAVHFLVNFAIASKITGALVPDNWRWGVGMFTIINPVVTAPIITILALQQWQALKAGVIRKHPYTGLSFLAAVRAFVLDIDLLGLSALTFGFLLVLLPLTIETSAPHGYGTVYIIAMFVLGGLLLIAFPAIELYVSSTPLVDIRRLFRNRDVLTCCTIIFIHQFSIAMTYTPSFQWVEVTFGWSTTNATYFFYTQSAALVVFGIIGGFIATVTRHYKWLTFTGGCIQLLGLGLMLRYRSPSSTAFQVVIPQVIQGIGSGFLTANVLVVAQQAVPHAELAIITGFFLLIQELGAAIGGAVVGAVQQNLLGELRSRLGGIIPETAILTIYKQGYAALLKAYPIGTQVRSLVIEAWEVNMYQIVVGGITVAAVNLLSCFLLADRTLSDKQNRVENEPTEIPLPGLKHDVDVERVV